MLPSTAYTLNRDDSGRKSLSATVASAGQLAAPSTPLSASTIPGTNPDVTKMVGTPAQLPSQMGGTPPEAKPQSLGDAVRSSATSGQVATASTADAKASADAAAAKKFTGDHFQDSAQKLIDSVIAGRVAAAAAPPATIAVTPGSGVTTPANPAASATVDWNSTKTKLDGAYGAQAASDILNAGLRPLEEALASGDTAAAEQAYAVTQKLITEAGHPAPTRADIEALVTRKDVGQLAAAATPDSIHLGDPGVLEQLGVTAEDVSRILGTGVDMSKVTLSDLSKAAAAAPARARAERAALASQLSDPGLGAHEKSAAAAELLARGGLLTATERDASEMAVDMQKGTSIDIGGTQYTPEELLADDKFANIIRDYVGSPADSAARKELDAKLPSLANFIKKHEQVLSDATKLLDATGASVEAKQAANSSAWTKLTDAATGLPDTFWKGVLDPATYTALTSKYGVGKADLSKSALAQVFLDPAKAGIADGDVGRVAANLTKLQAADPELAKQLAKLDPASLKATGLLDNSQDWGKFVQARTDMAHFKDATPEQVLQLVLGPDANASTIQKMLDDAKADAAVDGGKRLGELRKWFDLDHDGKIDDLKRISATVKNTFAYDNRASNGKFMPASSETLDEMRTSLGDKFAAAPKSLDTISYLINEGPGADFSKNEPTAANMNYYKAAEGWETRFALGPGQINHPLTESTYAAARPYLYSMQEGPRNAVMHALDRNARIRAWKDITAQTGPTGYKIDVPPELMPDEFRTLSGLPPGPGTDAYADSLDVAGRQALEANYTYLANAKQQAAKTGDEDYDSTQWDTVLGNMKAAMDRYDARPTPSVADKLGPPPAPKSVDWTNLDNHNKYEDATTKYSPALKTIVDAKNTGKQTLKNIIDSKGKNVPHVGVGFGA